MSGKNIPINKGNYTMETPERDALFEGYRGEGWADEYRAYRANWSRYPKEQFVSEYPLLVDLELSTLCNLKCPMCYTITDEFKGKVNAKLMEFSLFRKIIDEIDGHVPAIRLSLRGEPTIHPEFIECIRYAKEKGIKEVSTLTNGSRLEQGFFKDALAAGIDWITVSVDGLDGAYEKIRRPLKFNDILRRLKDIKRIKEELGVHKPVIKVQAIWPSIRENPEAYYNTFAPIADLIAFNPLIDYLGKDEEIIYEEDFTCPQHYQRLVVGADGSAMMCSNDEEGSVVVGNARSESVYDIWHGERLNKIRKAHKKKNGFMEIPVCRRCYLPRLTEGNERATVNGREFIIKNYVNRNQDIGK
ncbi:MAG: SPASM domain-containing protein [Deltaproteobacteria bacterium]|nr:SPASM domain-containing protein [Deltaproteobacteria bacterium]